VRRDCDNSLSHPGRHRDSWPHVLDPNRLPDYIDPLYRAAWAFCGSPHDADDLVQETFVKVLKRPRLIRDGNELSYLMRALRNTYSTHYRVVARHPTRELYDDDVVSTDESTIRARELMEAISSAPPLFRDAVIAVDVLGLSYREAARSLETVEATITSRLYRGRQHVARALTDESGDLVTPRKRGRLPQQASSY
jgi:RNA polymerase sigma-70 factor, ECF subfamily